MTVRLLACVVVLLAALPASAQKPAERKPGDEMVEKYLAKETEKLSQKFLDGAKTLDEWQAKRPRLHREYLDMLGLWPLPEKTPLRATVTGIVERGNVVIEKLHFQSKPHLYVTANLYRPKASGGRKPPDKLPAVLYVCGHSGKGRDGNKTAFQDHGMWFASNGYVCLVLDTLQLGEIPGVHHGTYGIRDENYAIRRDPVEVRWWWQALGYTPAGVECWNGIRGIDYLVSLPEVDPERIAVTGISGGGAATFWMAAADERVKCAVPVSGMSDLESYVTNKVINGHCDCMFLVNTYQWEWTTIAALVAPRPMLFANSDNDSIFPMDGNRRIADRLRKLYAMYGKSELFDDYVSKGGHDYRPDLRVAIFKWINKHIKGDAGPVKDADFEPLPGKDLRVFAEDKDLPTDAINAKIDQTFVKQAEVKLPEQGKIEEWKKELIGELRRQSFRAVPDRIAQPIVQGVPLKGEGVELLETEPCIRSIECVVYLGSDKSEPPTLVVLNPSEGVGSAKTGWAMALLGHGGNRWLFPRGAEQHSWTTKSPPNYVERAHALLGRAVDEGRVRDILAMLTAIHAQEKLGVRLVGRGSAGILAAYAALFDPTVREVIIVDPPTSHTQGPTFLNVLRVLDIPEALGLLAPRPLTLVNAKDKAFDRTAQIYKLAGAEGKFQRK